MNEGPSFYYTDFTVLTVMHNTLGISLPNTHVEVGRKKKKGGGGERNVETIIFSIGVVSSHCITFK